MPRRDRKRYGPPTDSDQMQANNEIILNQISQLEESLKQSGTCELEREMERMRETVNEGDDEDARYSFSPHYFDSVGEFHSSFCLPEFEIVFITEEFLGLIKTNIKKTKLLIASNIVVQYLLLLILLFTSSRFGDLGLEDKNGTSDSDKIFLTPRGVLLLYSPVIILLSLSLFFRVASLYFLTADNLKRISCREHIVQMWSWFIWLLLLLCTMASFIIVVFVAGITSSVPSFLAMPFLLLWSLHRPFHHQIDHSLHLCSLSSSSSLLKLFYLSLPSLFFIYPRPLPKFAPRARLQVYLSYLLTNNNNNNNYTSSESSRIV